MDVFTDTTLTLSVLWRIATSCPEIYIMSCEMMGAYYYPFFSPNKSFVYFQYLPTEDWHICHAFKTYLHQFWCNGPSALIRVYVIGSSHVCLQESYRLPVWCQVSWRNQYAHNTHTVCQEHWHGILITEAVFYGRALTPIVSQICVKCPTKGCYYTQSTVMSRSCICTLSGTWCIASHKSGKLCTWGQVIVVLSLDFHPCGPRFASQLEPEPIHIGLFVQSWFPFFPPVFVVLALKHI